MGTNPDEPEDNPRQIAELAQWGHEQLARAFTGHPDGSVRRMVLYLVALAVLVADLVLLPAFAAANAGAIAAIVLLVRGD